VDSGIFLVKYWFEVGMEEQERRFNERIADPTKQWKLSPMDIEAIRRWYDFSRARDAMFAATDTTWSPWHVVQADDKRRARLNCISHLLSTIPYRKLAADKVKLPKRQKAQGYEEPRHPYRWVPERY
jgi:polyphosphate kinase